MANTYIAKTNFTAGEWTEELAGRVDLPQFANAVKRLRNWLLLPRGGIQVRPGGVFTARTKFSNKFTRLMPFEFNVEQTYVVEMGDLYMRFFAENVRVEETGKAVTAVTDVGGVDPVQITVVGHGYSNGNHVALRVLGGAWQINRDWQITGVTADTFRLVGAPIPSLYTTGGFAFKIVEIPTVYLDSQVFQVNIAQSADTAYLFHSDQPTQKLTRTGAITFSISEVDWLTTPFEPENLTSTTLANSVTAVGATGTLTASASLFTVDDVGRYYSKGTPEGVCKVTSFVSATVVNMVVKKAFANTTASTIWSAGSWCKTLGYPSCGTFFDNRLVVGATNGSPQTFWGSKSGEFENFDQSAVTAEFGYEWTVASNKANIIRWIIADDTLFIGTSGQELRAFGGNDEGITPTNIQVTPQAPHGCFDTAPMQTSSGIVFLQRGDAALGGLKVRVLTFNIERDKYVASDLSLLSNEITQPGVLELAYQDEPNEIIWGIKSNGGLVSLTLLTEQNVIAWALHGTQGLYTSVEAITKEIGSQTWTIVDRVVNGVIQRMVEYFDPAIALDAAVLSTFASPITTVTGGLEHLEGRIVKIIGDGAVYPDQVVTNGGLPATFSPPIKSIKIGLAYTPLCELFLPTRDLPNGRSDGRRIKTNHVVLRVKDNIGLTVNGQINYTRSSSDLMDTAPVPETDDLLFQPDIDWNQTVTIEQHLPFQSTVLAAFQLVEIGD